MLNIPCQILCQMSLAQQMWCKPVDLPALSVNWLWRLCTNQESALLHFRHKCFSGKMIYNLIHARLYDHFLHYPGQEKGNLRAQRLTQTVQNGWQGL